MATPQDQPGGSAVQDLTGASVGRFVIQARLGAGGMGQVYRAEDTTLKRSVALKRMAPRLRTDPDYRRRFLKEAERASSLSDHRIASVYDVLEERGETFLVMEYVEGSTLRQRLHGAMSLEDFLPIATQCAEALVAAHAKSIIHRDIKPENIMLTPQGQIKILDFGVAKRLPRSEDETTTGSTGSQPGTLPGTPAYMAPEVLLEREPDGRADIFSLGVVFYEVLSGRHPFLADSFVATSDRILHEVPPPLSESDSNVPPQLERIVARMLAKDPADRYASAGDLLTDLHALTQPRRRQFLSLSRAKRRLAVMAGVLGILGLLVVVALPPVRRSVQNRLSGTVPSEKNLAVLPFAALGEDPRTTAFGDGLTETLTAKLTQLTDRYPLQVVPPSEVRAQRVSSVMQAREELGVNLVLEGSLHRAGELVRVNFMLVDARTRRQIRADTITAAATDPFVVEDQVVDGVVRMLGLEVQPQERQTLATHGTQVASAFDVYLQGRGYLQNYDKPENIDSAIRLFQEALRLDPSYSQAFAGLGEAYWRKYEDRKDPASVEKARQACHQAEVLNAKLAEANTCLGTLHNGTGQYEKAVADFQRALENEPTQDAAYRGLAWAFERLGRLDDAEKAFRRAIGLRPQYWVCYNWLGGFYYRQGRYARAADMFSKMTALVPDSFWGYNNLGGAYLAAGRYADAVRMFERSVSIRPMGAAYSNLGTANFYQRRFSEAARAFEQAARLDERDYMVWGNLGDVYYWGTGDRDRAVGAYRQATLLAEETVRVNPRDVAALGYLAYYHAMLKERSAARAYIERAVAVAPDDPEMRFNVALAYHQLGEDDRALEWLGKAQAAGFSPTSIRDVPILDNLRANPRFQQLLRMK